MKIFQIITVSELGGAQSVVANLCKELVNEHQLFILYGGEGESWVDLDRRVVRIRLCRHRKELSLLDVLVFFKLLYYRFRYQPDIVHLHSSKMGALGRMAFPKSRTVYTVHGFDSIRIAFRKFLFVEKLLAPKTGRIVGVSDYDLQGMKEEGIEGRLQQIYNGIVDCNKEEDLKKQDLSVSSLLEDIRIRYPRVVMCIARVSKPKRPSLFVEVSRLLPDYAFIWIGNNQPMENMGENVFFLGNIVSACLYLPYCDVFVLPSDYEGLPISILEAFSMAKPVVSSAVGGVPELIENGVNGYVSENDPEAFADKIKQVLDDHFRYNSFCEEARKCYLKYFTVNRMTAGYCQIYKDLVGYSS